MAAAKRARVGVSKNRKKSWGKHCDIKDVEDFLEDERTKERNLGPESERKPIFYIDKNPVSASEVITNRKNRPFKCHQYLGQYSLVPTPLNPQRLKTGKKEELIKNRKLQKKAKNILNSRNIKSKKTDISEFRDLWADQGKKDEDTSYIEDLIEYEERITKVKPVKVPCFLYQKPSLLPAVEVPHPGASYNPAYSDHQELLQQAVAIEEKKEKSELHLKRILTDMFPSKADAPTEETVLQEMSQGLFDENAEDDVEPSSGKLSINPPTTDETRKLKAQRRKEKERKKMEEKRAQQKKERIAQNKVFRMKSIKAEIKKSEEITKQRIAKREQKAIDRLYQPHTLSRYKFEPNDLEVNLSDELKGSLREVKVEGNVLEDRYKSLQKRNIIEPRIKQKVVRKYKVKYQVKRSHRNFE